MDALRHQVFLSYSRRDTAVVEKIVDELRLRGLHVWVDTSGLEPGTAHWGNAIQKAISNSFAVVWVASPNSKTSPYVKDEVDTAISQGISIFPVWVDGVNWHEAAWIGSGQMQYVDCRGDNFTTGVSTLIASLTTESDKVVPKYVVNDKFQRELPNSFLSVQLKKDLHMLVNLNKYESIASLLRDIWENLKAELPPYTYGLTWLLMEETNNYAIARVLAPIEWCSAFAQKKPVTELYPNWSKSLPLSSFGFTAGSRWKIVRNDHDGFRGIHGIVSPDRTLIDGLITDEKLLHTLLHRKAIKQRDFRSGDKGIVVRTWFDLPTACVVAHDPTDLAMDTIFKMLFRR